MKTTNGITPELDNNVAARALKMAILRRKNSLSFKTLRGASIGDGHMSLIHTCQLNRLNPFDYLMALQRQPPPCRKPRRVGGLGIMSRPSRLRAAVDSPRSDGSAKASVVSHK